MGTYASRVAGGCRLRERSSRRRFRPLGHLSAKEDQQVSTTHPEPLHGLGADETMQAPESTTRKVLRLHFLHHANRRI